MSNFKVSGEGKEIPKMVTLEQLKVILKALDFVKAHICQIFDDDYEDAYKALKDFVERCDKFGEVEKNYNSEINVLSGKRFSNDF